MRSAVAEFDAAIAYARAVAATSGNGATLVFNRRVDANGSVSPGFVLVMYSGRPTSTSALQPAHTAPVQSTGGISEAKLGAVPFTIFLDGAGHVSGMSGTVAPGTVLGGDPGCPPGEPAFVFTFSDPRATQTRTLPCNAPSAGAASPVPTP
jgi:hypothetical protein